jgi:hypothetical protein
MARPVGIIATTTRKNNDNKKYREATDWLAGKKIGRPKQTFNKETNSWQKEAA